MLLSAIAVYLLLQLAIGYWVGRRIRGEADYFLAGRSLGLGLAAISLFATWFGAETVMGSSSAIAQEGLAGSRADPFGYALCLLLMGLLLAYKMRAVGYMTLGDFFRDRFGSRVEKLAVVIFMPTSLLWAAAQLLALSIILSSLTGWSQSATLAGSTLFILLYTLWGGMMADVIHDLIQGTVVVLGLGTLTWVLVENSGGISAAIAHIEPRQLQFTAKGESLWQRLDTWAVPVLGSLVAQEALSRLLATRDAPTAKRACLLAAGIYLLVGLLPVVAGLLGPHLLADLPEGDGYIVALAEQYLHPLAYVIFTGALVAAILSTIDSTLLSLGALLEHNLISPLLERGLVAPNASLPPAARLALLGKEANSASCSALPPETTDKRRLRLARACVALSALAAYGFASGSDRIYDLLEQASSFGSAGILVSTLIGLHCLCFGGGYTATATLLAGVAASIGGNLLAWDTPYLTALALALGTYLLCAAAEYCQTRRYCVM